MKKLSFYFSFLLLFGLAIGCLVIVFGNVGDLYILTENFAWLYQRLEGKLLIAALGMISLACSYNLLLSSLNIDSGARNFIIQKNESGSIGISIDAIEQFISRTAKNIQGVRDVAVRTEEIDENLIIQVKLVLDLDRKVPSFVPDFQQSLHRELSETLGLNNIHEIQVLIDKVVQQEEQKPPFTKKEEKNQILLRDKETTPQDSPQPAGVSSDQTEHGKES